ncbi:Transient receptor potential channel pyrexia [Orchesella cincta]|uniref:Transient receptor potential channel pyrexia n=1 Tax=Orchesella cincta TaxID=48709 RepID=A0A1D2MII3_ORCCI|nr:Transient receptor potential channel pyrexia [Orchesella cincta]
MFLMHMAGDLLLINDERSGGVEGNIEGSTEYPMLLPDGSCEITGLVHMASALLLILSVIIAVKELFQFVRLRSLYIRFENVGQCILLSFIFASMPNLYLIRFGYQPTSLSTFSVWNISGVDTFPLPALQIAPLCPTDSILWINSGHIILPDHGIYVEILTEFFKNFLVFITIFSSLLISFVFSFNILLPNSTGFINLSNSVLKVLTMMTGELNYDEIFHSEEEKLIYPFSSHIMYAIFIMVATIILFNLLIGFTVSDIQGLQKDAEVNQISNKLEQIFLMECFLLSTPMQFIFGLFGKVFLGAGRNHIFEEYYGHQKNPKAYLDVLPYFYQRASDCASDCNSGLGFQKLFVHF